MIVDTSALVAIVLAEPRCEVLRDRLGEATHVGIGAPTLVETRIVLTARLGAAGSTILARVTQVSDLEVISFTDDHAEAAHRAFSRFGKGRHRAGLNLGDCFSYATAWVAREPLLFVGDDFVHTDLDVVGPD